MKKKFKEWTLAEHFQDLRKRFLFALIGIAVGVIIGFFFAEQILVFLTQPIGGFEDLQAIEINESLNVFVRVALISGFILSLPWTILQLLLFFLPALKTNEKKWIFLVIPLAFILFISGAFFTFYVLVPPAVKFLTGFLDIESNIRLKNYVDFVTSIIFWVGVCFEAPLLSYVLSRLNLINARLLLKGWRIAIVISAIVAAVITPTGDPVNMALLMAPLLVLYLLSILMAAIATQRQAASSDLLNGEK